MASLAAMSSDAGPIARGEDGPRAVVRLRAMLILVLSGAAGLLFVLQLGLLPAWLPYVLGNALPLPTRAVMVGPSVLFGLCLAIAGAWLTQRRAPSADEAVDRLRRLSLLFCPGVALPFIPPLFVRGGWEQRELLLLTSIGLVSLGLERLLGEAFAVVPLAWSRRLRQLMAVLPARVGPVVAVLLIFAAALYYFFAIGERAVLAHHKMLTSSSDLAEFDNLFFNALHGHPFRSPAIEGELENFSALKVHAEFGIYLLLPFYALRPNAESLLWIQAGVIALTAVPAYLLAAQRLGRPTGVVFGLVVLFLPVVQRPNFYDFHFSPLGMLLVMWTLYFLEAALRRPAGSSTHSTRRHWVAFWCSFVLALLSREDVSLGLAVVGFAVAFGTGRLRLGLTIAGLSVAYFGVMKFGIMPLFGQMWFDAIYQDLKAEGAKGFFAVALTLVSNPAFVLRSLLIEPKFLYLLHMCVPVACLWLRRPYLWFVAAPGFISTLLVTNRAPMFESSFQYAYLWVPYVLMGGVLYLSSLADDRLGRARRRAATVALGLAATASCFQLGILLGGEKIRGGFGDKTFVVTEADSARLEHLRGLIAKVSPAASVAATEAVGPHVSSRLVMYSLKFGLGFEPDFLLVEPTGFASERRRIRDALNSGEYGVVDHRGPFWLVERGANKKLNRSLLRLVGR